VLARVDEISKRSSALEVKIAVPCLPFYTLHRISIFYTLPSILTEYPVQRIKLGMNLARDSRQIGNSIRLARKRKGWSQGELAQRTGLRQGTISMAETGSAEIKIQTLLAILSTLDLEMHISPRSSGDSNKGG